MKGINHQLTTGSAYLICHHYFESWTWMDIPTGLLIAMVGTLLPDLDCRTSTLGRIFPFISVPIQKMFGHRGAVHSLFAAAGVFYLASQFNFNFACSLTFGFVMHLIGDACTKSGVNFLWPITIKFRVPLTPASNSFLENCTTWTLCAFTVWLYGRDNEVIMSLYPQVIRALNHL
ncbi:hypothetical protein BCU68_04510 [Vibrio sp. 10N.286.49.B3]|uniref:metal-dependent hydrolase n=1 Tax=Vibrio sp. 10N.286.49.B3 TaxID=1880855 RepID=UPI000C825882|nr:metal-dependent hydrolase [Vibrio sp. 10N.286.49.B3]PMH43256.1 hypothetical protein BCU68_04510 [Vibrio sp. 10N.286.49.B3]